MDNIKNLLTNLILAVQGVDKERKGLESEVKKLIQNPATTQALGGFLGAVTPRGLSALIGALEKTGILYGELRLKVQILNEAMPGIAEAIEKANAGKGLIPFGELVAAGKAVEEEMDPPKAVVKNVRRKQPNAN